VIPFEERIAGFIARVVIRFIFMIPAAIFYFLVYLGRRIHSWHVAGRALSWPAADATVYGTYKLDENEVSFSVNGWGEEGLETKNYHARWAVALQYGFETAGEFYSGTYFLPATYSDGDLAFQAEKAWAGKTIVVRYNPSHPGQSFFLEQDGAPGKPHIPRLLSYQPYLTDLSLR
jgi:hypothetical protein